MTVAAVLTMQDAAAARLLNLEHRKRKPAKPATLALFSSFHRVHIVPLLGSLPIDQVSNATLRDFAAHLSSKNLSSKTVNDILVETKAIVASVVDSQSGEIVHFRKWNAKFIDSPVIGKQKQPCVTPTEIEAALAVAPEFDRAMIALACGSGIRIGELLGLRLAPSAENDKSFWDPDTATLTIKSSVWQGQEQTPKTQNSYRQIEITDSLNTLLKDFVGPRSDGFLFGNGKPMSDRTLRGHLEKLLPAKGFHSLRRFRARHLRASHVPEEITKFWLGHSNKGDLTSTYSQLWNDAERRRAEAKRAGLGFLLKGAV